MPLAFSSYQTTHHPFSARVQSSKAPSSPIGRSTTFMWRSNTLIWNNRTCVAICGFKVREYSHDDSSHTANISIGLTEDHPTLTTFFEGEIIGTKHTFQTKHPSWGATDKTDMSHWARFSAWRPLAKKALKPDFTYKNFAQRENIFMRWKEYFLVPDHRVTTIQGASFEGFYYICFNQVQGTVSGIYFHAKSEK